MEAFIAARAADRRFAGGRVECSERTAVSGWYSAGPPPQPVVTKHWFSAKAEAEPEAKGPEKEKPTKKKRKKPEGGETSDGTDNGRCWSDYEAVPGKEPNEKGSCRPKKEKKEER
jgi:hypothetical protein